MDHSIQGKINPKETDNVAVKHLLLSENLVRTQDFSEVQSDFIHNQSYIKAFRNLDIKLNIFLNGLTLKILHCAIQKSAGAGPSRGVAWLTGHDVTQSPAAGQPQAAQRVGPNGIRYSAM